MSTMKIACTVLLVCGAASASTAAATPAEATATAVPAHFEAGSVSFISASEGFVLGTSPCTTEPCAAALVMTADGSKTWASTAAPHVPFSSASSPSSGSVGKVLFANASDGWVYGPTLWATYNGAQTWAKVKLGGPVYLLATSADEVYAVVGSCSPSAHNCRTPTLKLERAIVGSDAWHTVGDVSGYGTTAVLFAKNANAWVSFAPKSAGAVMIWKSSNSGSSWQRLPDPCYDPSEATDLAALASPRRRPTVRTVRRQPGRRPGRKIPLGVDQRRDERALCKPATSRRPRFGRRRSDPQRHPGDGGLGSQLRVPLDQRRQHVGNPWLR